MLFELGLEPLEQRESIRRRARKAGDDFAARKPAHLLGVRFEHGLAEADLPVRRDHDLAAFAHRQDRRPPPNRHLGVNHE